MLTGLGWGDDEDYVDYLRDPAPHPRHPQPRTTLNPSNGKFEARGLTSNSCLKRWPGDPEKCRPKAAHSSQRLIRPKAMPLGVASLILLKLPTLNLGRLSGPCEGIQLCEQLPFQQVPFKLDSHHSLNVSTLTKTA